MFSRAQPERCGSLVGWTVALFPAGSVRSQGNGCLTPRGLALSFPWAFRVPPAARGILTVTCRCLGAAGYARWILFTSWCVGACTESDPDGHVSESWVAVVLLVHGGFSRSFRAGPPRLWARTRALEMGAKTFLLWLLTCAPSVAMWNQ